MKIEENVKKTVKIALIFVAIGVLLGTLISYAATPTSTIYIYGGVFPGAASYTVWAEGSNYFAKNAYGLIPAGFSGTNASDVLQNCFDQLTDGGTVLLQADITLTTRIEFPYNGIELIGDGIKTVTVNFDYAGECIRIGDGTTKISYGAIKNLEFEGAASFSIDQYAVHGNYSTGITIEDCDFNSMWGNNSWAIVLQRSSAYRIEHCRFWNNYNGIKINGSSSNTINEIFNNYITRATGWDDNSYGTAVWVGSQAAGTTITDNCLENHNVRIHTDANGVIIKGNYFEWDESKYLTDIKLDGSYCEVLGNQFSENLTVTGYYNKIVGNRLNDYDIDDGKGNIISETMGATFPVNPIEGQLFYHTTNDLLYVYNGTHWNSQGAGAQGPPGPAGGLEGAQPYSYLIFENVTSKYLQDGSDGSIITNNADASVLVQYVVDNYDTWWLHFCEGTFECQTQVDFGTETYFMITGSGWSTIIQLTANLGTATDFWEWDYTGSTHGRFIIKDLYFDMQGDTYTSRDCLSIVGGERWKFENIKILMPYRDGLNIDETGGAGYTRYNTVQSFQVYYAGRYGVYCDGRDNNFFDIQIEYSWDSCFVFDAAGVGNSLFRLHATGAHNTDQYYGSGAGGGLGRYAGLEIRGTVAGGNTCHGVYLDRCNKTGAYITGSNNALMGGRVYECNYQAGSSAYADVYIDGDYNRVVGMELNGQSSNPTNYGVHLDTGSNNCAVTSNIGRDHAIAHFQDDGANNQVGYNA